MDVLALSQWFENLDAKLECKRKKLARSNQRNQKKGSLIFADVGLGLSDSEQKAVKP